MSLAAEKVVRQLPSFRVLNWTNAMFDGIAICSEEMVASECGCVNGSASAVGKCGAEFQIPFEREFKGDKCAVELATYGRRTFRAVAGRGP